MDAGVEVGVIVFESMVMKFSVYCKYLSYVMRKPVFGRFVTR